MSRARAFERYWAEYERPGRPAAESVPPAPELVGVVATATALRQHGEAIPAMDLDLAWQGLAARLEIGAAPATGSVHPAALGNGHESTSALATVTVLPPRVHRTLRVAAMAVAATIALATVSLQAAPGSALYPVRLTVERVALAISPKDGTIHLRMAEARLGDLLVSLRKGAFQAAPGLARSLMANRAAAGRAGAELRDLDLRITLEVPPALGQAPRPIATAVRAILGSLLPPLEKPLPTEGPPAPPAPGQRPAPGGGRVPDPSNHQGSGSGDHDREGDGGHESRDEDSEESNSHEDSHSHVESERSGGSEDRPGQESGD